ncbi:MAG: nicotinamide-nucleotide adenylyltransferase [Promethearchaeota archaeon]|nr:MAG: nicotinamide-nucleotide adenylyltransferase [Candidatus Lokiarchaeota archaeon]
MEKEILACIDTQNIKYLQAGQISKYIFPMERKEAHDKKVSHLIIRFFVMTITPDDKILYLVQKRGRNKKSYPEYFTDSASGHVTYENNLDLNRIKDNAIRELEEEFGIPEKAIQKIVFYDLNAEENKFTKEIAYIFFGLVDHDVNLKPDTEELEIEGSKFYTKSELKHILQNEDNVDYSKQIWEYLLNTNIKTLFKTQKTHEMQKKETTALFIGRFQPLHHGHIFVIYRILENHNKIKIGIGSAQLANTKNDPFTNEERKRFIKAALKKRKIPPSNYEIYDIPDIFNAKKWVDHVVSIVGDFDIMYSNSDWVRELFQNKGYQIGKKLGIFRKKYNATHVRKLISQEKKNWTSLVPNEVINVMKNVDGIQRIQSLYNISEKA